MSYNSPRDKHIPIKSVQVHPRVLKEDRACSDCTQFKVTPSFDYCFLHDKQTSPYNECSAYEKKVIE